MVDLEPQAPFSSAPADPLIPISFLFLFPQITQTQTEFCLNTEQYCSTHPVALKPLPPPSPPATLNNTASDVCTIYLELVSMQQNFETRNSRRATTWTTCVFVCVCEWVFYFFGFIQPVVCHEIFENRGATDVAKVMGLPTTRELLNLLC